MLRSTTARFNFPLSSIRHYGTTNSNPPPIIDIKNGTLYRHHPNSTIPPHLNPPLFQNLNFSIPSSSRDGRQHWSIIGPSSSGKTTFLQLLRGKHLSIPPTSRTYPYLSSSRLRTPDTAIKQVGFDGEQGLGAQAPQSAYLSARYESRREDTDFSVLDYLLGNTQLNLSSKDIDGEIISQEVLERVVKDLRLGDLIDMPVSNLSNGQTRRARIAKALLGNPEVLLLDEPFMGLDPPSLLSLSPMLGGLAERGTPRLVLSLRPQDPIPEWVTHLVYLKGNCEVAFQGAKMEVLGEVRSYVEGVRRGGEKDEKMEVGTLREVGRMLTSEGIVEADDALDSQAFSIPVSKKSTEPEKLSRDGYPMNDLHSPEIGEPLVEMEGAVIAYGNKTVLGNWKQTIPSHSTPQPGLWWTVRRGQRWGIFGPNGSGKTTLLSLICSDHPQTYSLPIRLFGRSRLPEPGKPGISIFDLQSRIGHSSPEIHSHIPRSLSLRQVLENAWSDTFRGVPKLDEGAKERVDAALRWFERDLRTAAGSDTTLSSGTEWANHLMFGGLPFSSQRVALFLRAVIKSPDLVILDEAFSGMDEGVRDRCLLFLAHGESKEFSKDGDDTVVESRVWRKGEVKIEGLSGRQALIVISHVKEEIPGSVREWICLPEGGGGGGRKARFGRLRGPIEGDARGWRGIWGL